MEITVARKRLEEMRDDLDRTVLVLRGEHPLSRGGTAEAGDAGANLTEADRKILMGGACAKAYGWSPRQAK